MLIRAYPQSLESPLISYRLVSLEVQDHRITTTTTPDIADRVYQHLNSPVRCFYSMAWIKSIHALMLVALLAITSWTVPTMATEDGSDTLLKDGSDGLYSVQEVSRHGRVKRQTVTLLAGPQRQMVLDAFNNIRSAVGITNGNPTASDMEQLVSM